MCGKDRAASRIVLREVKRPLNSNKGNKQSLSEKIQKLKPKFTPLNDPSVKTNKSPGTNNCLQTTSPDNPKQSKETLPLSSATEAEGIQGSKSPSKAEPRDERIFVRRGPSLRYGSRNALYYMSADLKWMPPTDPLGSNGPTNPPDSGLVLR